VPASPRCYSWLSGPGFQDLNIWLLRPEFQDLNIWLSRPRFQDLNIWLSGPGFQNLDKRTLGSLSGSGFQNLDIWLSRPVFQDFDKQTLGFTLKTWVSRPQYLTLSTWVSGRVHPTVVLSFSYHFSLRPSSRSLCIKWSQTDTETTCLYSFHRQRTWCDKFSKVVVKVTFLKLVVLTHFFCLILGSG
jgi:hypothetical protein